jgi:hypothetical protein
VSPLNSDESTQSTNNFDYQSFSTKSQAWHNFESSPLSIDDRHQLNTIEKENIIDKQRRKQCKLCSPFGCIALALLFLLFLIALAVVLAILLTFEPTTTTMISMNRFICSR